MQKFRLVHLLLALALVAGCAEEPPPEEDEVKPPPPPSGQEVQQDLSRPIQPILNMATTGTPLAPNVIQEAESGLNTQLQKHNANPNLEEAKRQVAGQVRQMINQANESELWQYVVAGADIYGMLAPSNPAIERMRQNAEIQMRRPQLKLHGIMVVDYETNDRAASVTVTVPMERKSEKRYVRAGDEILGLEVLEIIGESGVRFKYLETGDTFEEYLNTR